jgi:hypothetical protein
VVEVAGGDVLLVAAEVGKSDGVVVEYVDEAGRAAAVLDVGPASFAGGGHVKGVAGGDEVALGFGEAVVGSAGLCDTVVGGTAAVEGLLLFDQGCEGYFGEALAHLDRLGCAEVEGRSAPVFFYSDSFRAGWLRILRSMIRCARNLDVVLGVGRCENVINYIERLISLP